jgi:tetratricopeptide (TPR) repeat protein
MFNPNILPKCCVLRHPTSRALIVAAGFLLISLGQSSFAERDQRSTLNELKLKARRAEDAGTIDLADKLYIQAIDQAKKGGTKTDVIEMISRLVRERAYNHKFGQIDSHVQNALDIIGPLVGTRSYDREMSIWMDDLADVFMDRGKRTIDKRIKDYCVRRYLDVELLIRNRYDPQLIGIASLRTTQLSDQGRYAEIIPIAQALLKEAEQNHRGHFALAMGNLVLASDFIAARKYDQAQVLLKRYFELISRGNKSDRWDRACMELGLSVIDFENKNFDSAIAKCKNVFATQDQMHLDEFSAGTTACLLAYYNERAGNTREARKYFHSSLAIFERAHPVSLPLPDADPIASGQVIAAERLADLESKAGNRESALKLRQTAKSIRMKHPNWSSSKNPDPMRFYVIYGHLPFPVEVFPTGV